jgi:hypothetical protein
MRMRIDRSIVYLPSLAVAGVEDHVLGVGVNPHDAGDRALDPRLLARHLAAEGWEIVSRAMPTERGADVVATRGGIRLEVEAKGGGHMRVSRFQTALSAIAH